jgi:hypothetical protein
VACIGTFLLADAGLLDHREATTTWWLAPLFRQRYLKVLLDETRMLAPSDVRVTAGAAMGHLDLVLWLIRKASPELATVVSRYLLADMRSSQAPYLIPGHLARQTHSFCASRSGRETTSRHGFRCRKRPPQQPTYADSRVSHGQASETRPLFHQRQNEQDRS